MTTTLFFNRFPKLYYSLISQLIKPFSFINQISHKFPIDFVINKLTSQTSAPLATDIRRNLNADEIIKACSILLIKRTFQPSLLRRKRKHGFLSRAKTRNGNKILVRRRLKKRRHLCA